MLLSLLNKEEKFYFVDLLIDLLVDEGSNSGMEEAIVNKLKYEMGEDVYKYKKSNLSQAKLIAYFSEKSKSIKNIVYLNIVGAFLHDEWYRVSEHFLLEDIQKQFKITEKKRIELIKLVYAERDLREKAKRVISE